MGKAKNVKKHRKRLGQTSDPVQLSNHADEAKVNLLLSNIGSIHDKKRAEACVLLANVFSKDVSNTVVLEKMSSPDVLSKLSMRLVDSVDMVRLHAAGAIRYLNSSSPLSFGVIIPAEHICTERIVEYCMKHTCLIFHMFNICLYTCL